MCRSTKTAEEVFKIALSYGLGNKYATSYVATSARGPTGPQGSSSGGGIQIKTEPVGTIRGGFHNNRSRGRGTYQGRGSTLGGGGGGAWGGGGVGGGGICSKTIDATTATNQILHENIWIDTQRKEPGVIFAVKLDILNVPVGGSKEIRDDGEQ